VPLRASHPLTWTVPDVASWLTNLKLPPSQFEDQEIDGAALFDLTDEDLATLLPTIGARKRFFRARVYVASAFNVLSTTALEEAFVRKLRAEERAEERLVDADVDSDGEEYVIGWQKHSKPGPAIRRQNATVYSNSPPWQRKEFKIFRDISGGITIVLEIGLNMAPRVHPAAHLAALLPAGLTGLLGYCFKKKL